MSKMQTIKEFAEVGFMRLGNATANLTEEQLDWKSCPEANTIRWILTHLISEFNGFVPKILAGDKDAEIKGVPEGYVGNKDLSLKQIMADLETGKKSMLKMLDETKDEALTKEMDWFMGKQPVSKYLMLAVSEVIHHEGQIAAILGVEKRMKGT